MSDYLKELYNMVKRVDKQIDTTESKLSDLRSKKESLMAEIVTLEGKE